VERKTSPSRSWISTSLGDLLLGCDLGAFLRVGSALDYTGTLVKDVTIGSKLLHAASASHFAGIDSLEICSHMFYAYCVLEYLLPIHAQRTSRTTTW
jgi:hypothetical protein